MLENLARVWDKPEPPQQQEEMGFFTDTTLCIGCKACEVACKQWNQLPADGFHFTGNSYDNTGELSATSWRHVKFIEQFPLPVVSGGVVSGEWSEPASPLTTHHSPLTTSPVTNGQR